MENEYKKARVVATLAAAAFGKMQVEADQDPIKALMTVYKKIWRRLDTATAALSAEKKPGDDDDFRT